MNIMGMAKSIPTEESEPECEPENEVGRSIIKCVSKEENKWLIEWTIEDILNYSKENERINSSRFYIQDMAWNLEMYPYGRTNLSRSNNLDSVGFVSLFLILVKDSMIPRTVHYTLGIKTPDGMLENMKSETNRVFRAQRGMNGWGFPRFLERSYLNQRKWQLAPSGELTVTCSFVVHDNSSAVPENLSREIGLLSQMKVTADRKAIWRMEWSIIDVHKYLDNTKEDVFFRSPRFIVDGSEWYLEIYPNGRTDVSSVGYVSLFLWIAKGTICPRNVTFTYAVRNANGTNEKIKTDGNRLFHDGTGTSGFGFSKYLDKSELKERAAELLPSDTLKIVCSIATNDSISELIRLSDNLKDLFISRIGCDATLKVKDQSFPVHKCILEARSAVFAAMFESNMMEKRTGIVDIVDCEPKAFKDFLLYLYCGRLQNLSHENAFELYRIADKYDVEDLKSKCFCFIEGNLTCENLTDAALLGHQYSEGELKTRAQHLFNKNFESILDTDKWKSFLVENLDVANELLANNPSIENSDT